MQQVYKFCQLQIAQKKITSENSYAFKQDRNFKYTTYIYVLYGGNVGLYWIKTTKTYDRSRIRNLVLCAFISDGTYRVRNVPPVQHIVRHITY